MKRLKHKCVVLFITLVCNFNPCVKAQGLSESALKELWGVNNQNNYKPIDRINGNRQFNSSASQTIFPLQYRSLEKPSYVLPTTSTNKFLQEGNAFETSSPWIGRSQSFQPSVANQKLDQNSHKISLKRSFEPQKPAIPININLLTDSHTIIRNQSILNNRSKINTDISGNQKFSSRMIPLNFKDSEPVNLQSRSLNGDSISQVPIARSLSHFAQSRLNTKSLKLEDISRMDVSTQNEAEHLPSQSSVRSLSTTRTTPTVNPNQRTSVESRRKPLVKKKYRRYMLPLLIAYKLKFFTLIPLLMGGLVLLAGSTGMAGFFFALFAAVMGLKGTGSNHG